MDVYDFTAGACNNPDGEEDDAGSFTINSAYMHKVMELVEKSGLDYEEIGTFISSRDYFNSLRAKDAD
jgi:hypothetical protein